MIKSAKIMSSLAVSVVMAVTFCSCGKIDSVKSTISQVKEKIEDAVSKTDNSSNTEYGKTIHKSIDELEDDLGKKWEKGTPHSERLAVDDALNQLIVAANNGDKEKFSAAFTKNIRNSEGFDKLVNEFFKAYPKGLGTEKVDGGTNGSNASNRYGHWIKNTNAYYTFTLDNKWYEMSFSCCYENTDSPDDLGVTHCIIENLEASAKDTAEKVDLRNTILDCRIVSSDEVTARLINNKAFVFKPAPDRKITKEQMKKYLKGHANINSIITKVGEPNVRIKYDNCTGEDFYYELVSDNDKPLYAHITAEYIRGSCIDASTCTDTGSKGSEVLLAWEKPEKWDN